MYHKKHQTEQLAILNIFILMASVTYIDEYKILFPEII